MRSASCRFQVAGRAVPFAKEGAAQLVLIAEQPQQTLLFLPLNRRHATMEQRPLFGGAIVCGIPSAWKDVSHVRQVPDNQECWQEIDTNGMLVIEILERQSQVADEAVASYLFGDLAEANGCDAANWTFTPQLPPLIGAQQASAVIPAAGLPENVAVCLGSGYQRIALGREFDVAGNRRVQEVRIVHVDLCVIRLPQQTTDLLITLSTPSEANPQIEDLSMPFRQILSTFQVRDWGLFK